MLIQLPAKLLRVSRRRMKPQIPVRESDDGHPNRQCDAEDVKGAAVDDPDPLRDGLKAVEGRVGPVRPALVVIGLS
jgi:hypothetical protein